MQTTGGEESRGQPVRARIEDVARSSFGWQQMRPGQLDAIEAALAGQDVLAVLPTGYGKSAIYQIAGLMIDGPTIVISPLISLQADQVAHLRKAPGGVTAVAINSTMRDREIDAAWNSLRAGAVEFVFLAPEQLANNEVVRRLRELRPRLVVVDEAHCVSAWGRDFRPDYLRLGEFVDSLDRASTIALTATGSAPVREEIIDSLRLHNTRVVIRGFDRPNLRLEVERVEGDRQKRDEVVRRVTKLPMPGLLYVATRADTERYASELTAAGLRAQPYSSALGSARRTEVHAAFSAGELDVVVATSAFGMGINKADVRFVVHAAVTDSVDDYYQEIGRAGRDGEAALAVLFYRPEDLALRRFFAGGAPVGDEIAAVVRAVATAGRVSREELAVSLDQSSRRVGAIVGLLQEAEVLVSDAGRVGLAFDGSIDDAVDRALVLSAQGTRIDRSRIEMIRGYAETPSCRRQYLLGYFGENLVNPCGNCDVCSENTIEPIDNTAAGRRGPSPEALPSAPEPMYPVESRVRHPLWGDGVVMRNEPDRMTVYFDDEGYKTLSLSAIAARGLLNRIT